MLALFLAQSWLCLISVLCVGLCQISDIRCCTLYSDNLCFFATRSHMPNEAGAACVRYSAGSLAVGNNWPLLRWFSMMGDIYKPNNKQSRLALIRKQTTSDSTQGPPTFHKPTASRTARTWMGLIQRPWRHMLR